MCTIVQCVDQNGKMRQYKILICELGLLVLQAVVTWWHLLGNPQTVNRSTSSEFELIKKICQYGYSTLCNVSPIYNLL